MTYPCPFSFQRKEREKGKKMKKKEKEGGRKNPTLTTQTVPFFPAQMTLPRYPKKVIDIDCIFFYVWYHL